MVLLVIFLPPLETVSKASLKYKIFYIVRDDSKLLSRTRYTVHMIGITAHLCWQLWSFCFLLDWALCVWIFEFWLSKGLSLMFLFAVDDSPFCFCFRFSHQPRRCHESRNTSFVYGNGMHGCWRAVIAHLLSTTLYELIGNHVLSLQLFFFLLPGYLIVRRYCCTLSKSSSRTFRSYASEQSGQSFYVRGLPAAFNFSVFVLDVCFRLSFYALSPRRSRSTCMSSALDTRHLAFVSPFVLQE